MALINCPTCHKEINDNASACPECDNPINESINHGKEDILACCYCGSTNLHSVNNRFGGASSTEDTKISAKTIDSKEIRITCLKCGRKFEAGEAKVIRPTLTPEEMDARLIEMLKLGSNLQAIKDYKDYSGLSLIESKQYIDKLAEKNGTVSHSKGNNRGGCYIATAVYGSYDCPEVWTLRRFRDYTLAQTWYGRVFIKSYYATSPTFVKWFGKDKWFARIWRMYLDRVVNMLHNRGVDNTPYQDK